MKAIPHSLLAGLLCVACANATPPAQEPHTPAAPVAQAAENAENHRAAAERLLELMNMQRVMDTMVEASLSAQVHSDPQLANFETSLRDFFKKYMSWQSMKEDVVKLYVEAYTQRELEDLLAFYATPTGKKSIQLTPELAGKGAEIGRRRVQEHLPELQQAIGARARELMHEGAEPKSGAGAK